MNALLLAAAIFVSLTGQGAIPQSPPQQPPAQQPQDPTQGKQAPPVDPDKQELSLVVDEVVFEGAKVFSSEELMRQLRLVGPGGWLRRFGRRNVYTREKFQEDAVALLKYMTDRGYLRASIGEPKIRFINIADAAQVKGDVPIRLIIPIAEGPLHKLGKLEVRDGSVLNTDQARAQFPIKEGDVINAGLMEAALTRLRNFYGRLGYLQFAPTIDFKFSPPVNNETVTDITITLNEGKKMTLGRLEFSGNIRTLDLPLRRIFPLNEGDLFDYGMLEEGIERLNRSGLFNPITTADTVITYDLQNNVANVEIRLTERDVQRIDVSGGAGTFGAFNFGLDYSNINLTGRLDNVAAQTRLGNLEQTASGRYGITLLTARPLTLSFTGSFQRFVFVDAQSQQQNQRPLYIQTSGGMTAGATIPVARGRNTLAAATRASLFYSLNFNSLEDLVAESVTNVSDLQKSNIRQASLTPALAHDTLQREFDPLGGLRLTTGTEVVGRALGANLNTIRPWIDFRQFIPLNEGFIRGERNTFGYRARAAFIGAYGKRFDAQTLSVIDGVPIFNRFFVGGVNEVRGFPINSISPVANVDRFLVIGDNPPQLLSHDVQPVGGDTEFIGNAEYRTAIRNRLSVAAFFDIGSSFNARGLKQEQFVSPAQLTPPVPNSFLVTVVSPLGSTADKIPSYRISVGFELRILVPVANLPLRLIFAFNPNAQTNPPPTTLLAPERKFAFVIGFGRTL